MNTPPIRTEEFKMRGDTLVGKLKEIVHEGNIRRITIKNEDGHTLIEIPLTVGVVGVILLPVWAAIGAIAALAANLTIVIERTDDLPQKTVDQPGTGAPTHRERWLQRSSSWARSARSLARFSNDRASGRGNGSSACHAGFSARGKFERARRPSRTIKTGSSLEN